MANWQVTAKTVFCESIAEEVTVMVYKDGSIKCTGFNKYSLPMAGQVLKKRSRELKRDIKCSGLECPTAIGYRDSLFAGEANH
jgi:hypothetical protein